MSAACANSCIRRSTSDTSARQPLSSCCRSRLRSPVYRHTRLERRKLLGRERRVGGHMTPDQGGDIGRVLHAQLSRPVPDSKSISRPQADRDPVQGGTAARWVGRQVGRLRFEPCTYGNQCQPRLRHLPLRGNRGEPALLLWRRTRRDSWCIGFRGDAVHCAQPSVAAERGHFAILPSRKNTYQHSSL